MRSILLFAVIFSASLFSQNFQVKWTSPTIPYATYAAFTDFEKSGDVWKSRLYTIDTIKFQVMEAGYSYTPKYTYTFSAAERLAGEQVFSLGYDLTGDNIVEFYVLGWYGTTTAYRQSFKIIDIVTGNVLLEKDIANSYYSYPIVWDIEGDGQLECLVVKFAYPSYNNYTFEVYSTGLTGMNDNNKVRAGFALKQNYPNPFNPQTVIPFDLDAPSNVRVEIFDIKGSLVKTLFTGDLEAGQHNVEWDGRNNDGMKCPSGIYMYNLSGAAGTRNRKMLLLK